MVGSQEARADTTDMLAIHKVFRNACSDGRHLVGNVDKLDNARRAVIGAYYDDILGFLHLHHEAEDTLLWPLLIERSPQVTELVALMESQHSQVKESLEASEAFLQDWASGGTDESRSQFIDSLGELGATLGAHLDEEESEILPLAAEYVTEEEWGAMPGYAMSRFTGRRWLIIGLVREQMTSEQRAHMLKSMAPPALEMWSTTGEESFGNLMKEIRSS